MSGTHFWLFLAGAVGLVTFAVLLFFAACERASWVEEQDDDEWEVR